MASRYDDELWELVPEEPGPPPAHLSAFVRSLGAVGAALDLGCGDGRLAAELDARELTAADVSAVALERARSRLPAARFVESTRTRRCRSATTPSTSSCAPRRSSTCATSSFCSPRSAGC